MYKIRAEKTKERRENMKRTKMQKGITLVALIITIIVLLILAMVAIRAIQRDGIIKHAQRAKDDYEQKGEEENGIISGYNDYINSQLGLSGGTTGDNEGTSYNGMYNLAGLEGKIAPTDLFDYEPIEGTGQTAALDNSTLPQKEIKITRIKPEYCNYKGYNPDTDTQEYANTNYEISYKGNHLSDELLVIPYQVNYVNPENGAEELYKVTEVDLSILGAVNDNGAEGQYLPMVKTIVYPNTVKSMGTRNGMKQPSGNNVLSDIVLSNVLEEIPDFFFAGYSKLTSVIIPGSVKKIGKISFQGCTSLEKIVLKEGVTNIEMNAFTSCYNLQKVEIPASIVKLGRECFSVGQNLSISYPKNISDWKTIGGDGCYERHGAGSYTCVVRCSDGELSY